MPYIKPFRRQELDDKMSTLLTEVPQCTSEEMNYIISRLMNEYTNKQELDYQICNTAVGILECVKLEFYNKLITPYENTKIHENGKLYNEYHTNLSVLKEEYKKVQEEIDACELIYSLHGCDSWEDMFRDNVPELVEKLRGIQIAIDEVKRSR